MKSIHLSRFGVWAAVILSASGLAVADVRISSYGFNTSMTVNAPNQFDVTVENLGPDPASGISLKATLPDGAELLPSTGCTATASLVTCTLPNLGAGKSTRQTVRFVPRNVARVRIEFEVQSTDDTNPANNSAGFDANIFPQNVLEVRAGSANPASRSVSKGQANLPVLQFALSNLTEFPSIFDDETSLPTISVDRIFLKAFGTGHDAKDINAVRIYEDTNNNGLVDATDRLLEATVFPGDDGTIILGGPNLDPSSPENRQITYLVAYDLGNQVRPGSLGALAAGMGLGALGFLTWHKQPIRRRRMAWPALGLLVLVFAACTSPSAVQPEPTSLTYGLKLTLLTTNKSSDIIQTSLPINGATLTVER